MSLHSIVQYGSGPVVIVLTLLAIAGFVAADLLRATGWVPSERIRALIRAAWPLSIATLAVVIIRVAVLS